MSESPKAFLQVCLSRSWGGLEMVAAETARAMKDKGFPSFVVCPAGSPLEKDCLKHGLPTLAMDLKKRPSPSRSRALRRFILEKRISDVVVHQLKDLWIVTPALWNLPRVRSIGFSHTFVDYRKKDLFHRLLYRRLDVLIALTDLHRENLIEHLPLRNEQLVTVPNSVSPERFHPSRRTENLRLRLGIRPEDVLIGVIGRLDPQKGQLETIEAAALLKKEGLPFHLVFVGEETKNSPGTAARMKERIRELSLEERITMLGFLENPEEVTASFDIFVMPSYAETFGKVLLEAMASETAVISTRAGGVPDIVRDGLEGLLVAPKDPVALAAAMKDLALDPGKRQSFGRAARERVLREFSTEVVQARLDQIFFAPPAG